MKFQLLLATALVLLTGAQAEPSLLQELDQSRDIGNKKLVERFPDLKEDFDKYHDKIEECYDQTLGNQSLNIFDEPVNQLIIKFFKSENFLRRYHPQQMFERARIFLENVHILAGLVFSCLERRSRGEVTGKYGLTSMNLYSLDEIVDKNFGRNLQLQQNGTLGGACYDCPDCSLVPAAGESIPAAFNWNEQGYISPVKKQDQCKACFVFAGIAAMESQVMIKSKKPNQPTILSEQALINCIPGACSGGDPSLPMEHFVKVGATLDKNCPFVDAPQACGTYPADAKAQHYCRSDAPGKPNDEALMQLWIMRNGPIEVGIVALPSLIYWKTPIYTEECPNDDPLNKLNHAVLLYGWDEKYWFIKNSWGTEFADKGHVRFPRGENKCGINWLALAPVIAKV